MTVILDFYKEMCQSACKTHSDLMWGKPVPRLGIRLRNSFSFCLCELRTFFTTVNCQLDKLKWKFSVGCGENLHQHYHSGENGKLAPKPSVSLSSTVQWYCFSAPMLKDHKCSHTCISCLFSASHTYFPVLFPDQDFTYSAQVLGVFTTVLHSKKRNLQHWNEKRS